MRSVIECERCIERQRKKENGEKLTYIDFDPYCDSCDADYYRGARS